MIFQAIVPCGRHLLPPIMYISTHFPFQILYTYIVMYRHEIWAVVCLQLKNGATCGFVLFTLIFIFLYWIQKQMTNVRTKRQSGPFYAVTRNVKFSINKKYPIKSMKIYEPFIFDTAVYIKWYHILMLALSVSFCLLVQWIWKKKQQQLSMQSHNFHSINRSNNT